jgi:hypothetical protein
MISKLIVHAESRPAALRKLVFALSRYQIGGISSNIQFLSTISTHPAFIKGEVTTKFIDVCGLIADCAAMRHSPIECSIGGGSLVSAIMASVCADRILGHWCELHTGIPFRSVPARDV